MTRPVPSHGRRLSPRLARALHPLLGVGRLVSALERGAGAMWGGTLEQTHIEPRSGRVYRVITRRAHARERPAPLLFLLHAYATHPDVALRAFALETLAVRLHGCILVVPEGLRDTAGNYCWNASAACCGEGPGRPDDLGYLRAVRAAVGQHYQVDSSAVLALGVSNGGFMAYRWACAAPAELAAIVSIAGAGPGPQDPPCAPRAPVSLLHIHGDRDQLVQYGGGTMREGFAYPSARDSIAPFIRAAEADPSPATRRTHSLYGRVREQYWSSQHATVALWTVEGGGHELRVARARILEILSFLLGQ